MPSSFLHRLGLDLADALTASQEHSMVARVTKLRGRERSRS
jgi:hypothetical protein